ncbi:MAG: HEAT repeat domain-containing protein, partial [Planctomycetales bacterium]|nr:HEAT repeat domain-containing protein [Planctomycetales bacterium]
LLELYQTGRGGDRGVWQQVRSEALQALARQGGERAYDALSRALTEEEDPFVRRWAAAGLGSAKFHNRESLGILEQALRSDADENTRYWAANSLGDIPDRRAGRALEDVLGRFPDKGTRKIVLFSLAKRKDPSLAPAIRADLERETESEMVRYAASKLVEVLDVEALPELEAARARHATNPDLKDFFDGWIPALKRKASGQQEQPDIRSPR